MKKLLFLLLMVANSLVAQDVDSLFTKGNTLYKNGEFEAAINSYKKIEAKDSISAELYLNLGNAYYKLNKVGPTIFYYEKALKLEPSNKDVKNNLVFAKRLALDTIKEVPKTVFQKFHANYIQQLSYNEWAILAVLFSFLASLFFLLFYFSYVPTRKRVYFTASILSFIILTFSIIITYSEFNKSKNNKEAIVFATETTVRNAPTLNADEVFILHEGTKVFVIDAVDNWKKIKLIDNRTGWIIAEEIKLLNNF